MGWLMALRLGMVASSTAGAPLGRALTAIHMEQESARKKIAYYQDRLSNK